MSEKSKKSETEKVKAHLDILDLQEKEVKEIPVLKETAFFLDYLVIEEKGIFGWIIPILITVGLFILGFVVGIYPGPNNPGVPVEAQAEYTFWVLFILFGTYLLNWFVAAIWDVIEYANKRLDVSKEKHQRIINRLFGTLGLIMSIAIALPFIIYDITGFGIPEEGWIYEATEGEDEWFRGISGVSVMFLSIWIIPWLYFGSFVWLSLGFLFYINRTLIVAPWRDNITKVIFDKQAMRMINLSIEVYIPIAIYLVIKLIFQIFFIVWFSDTVGTFILFVIFFAGVVIGPLIIIRDIKSEKKEALIKLHNFGYKFFEDITRDVLLGKDIDNKDVLKALILHVYNDDMYEDLEKKIINPKLLRKMTIAALAPIISYIAKLILSGGNLLFFLE